MLLPTFTARLFLQTIHSCSRLFPTSKSTLLQVSLVLTDINNDKYHPQARRIAQEWMQQLPNLMVGSRQPDLMLDEYVDPLMSDGLQ